MKTLFDESIQSDAAEFQDERKSGLGGSDAGAVYNLGFKCGRQTGYEKTGKPQDFKKTETPEMERGTLLESVIRILYERRTSRPVELKPLARHPDHDWMMVHIDGETKSPQHQGPGYVEFKCVNRFVFQRFKKEGVRDEYILQLQHGMAVKGYQWGSFGILCLDPWEFAWFDVERDQVLIDKLIKDEGDMWGALHMGVLPDPLPDLKDKRCGICPWRRTCRGNDLAESIPDSDQHKEGLAMRVDLAPLVAEIQELGQIKDEATELYEDARGKLKKEIGDAYGITVPGYRALYPTAYPERWDTKALGAIETEVKKLLSTEREEWDYDALESRCTELLNIVIALSKARKPPKPERSLRIYATGD